MTQQINLYDPALERKRDWLALPYVVTAALLLAGAVGGVGFLARQDLPALAAQAATGDSQIKALREQVTSLGQQVAARKTDPALERELAASRLLAAARSEVLSILQQGLGPQAISYAEYLRGFARQSVPGLWLTGFALNAGSGGMEISGRTLDPSLLPQYITRLNREQVFQGRAFSALKLSEGKADPAPGSPVQQGAAPAAKKAPFHEFKLVPLQISAGDAAGNVADPARAPSAGGRS